MISRITQRFRKSFAELLEKIQRKTKAAYRLFKENPYHPSLHLKQIHTVMPVYSVRMTVNYRAMGVRENDEIVWFWIGTHSDYEKLISQF
jgi:hypothetical protein